MSENKIKVSVIMPSLNVKEYIEECIESVVNQSLNEIEIICVDAGSDDGTLEILEKYANDDSRIKLIHADVRSYGHQVNLGINEANGEYVGIVETDDYIDKKMFESLYNLTDNGSCDIVKSNFYYFHDTTPPKFKPDYSKINLITNEKFTVYDDADFLLGHPSIWAAIYKKSFLEDNNIEFMEAPGGGWVDNPFLHQTALSAKSIVYTDEPFYYYRELNPNSSSNNLSDLTLPMRRMFDILDVLDEYSCNEDILTSVYIRIFFHIRDLMNMDLGSHKHELFAYFRDLLNRMDENIVHKRMTIISRLVYDKLLSNKDENSFSVTLLILFIKFVTKMEIYQDKFKYKNE